MYPRKTASIFWPSRPASPSLSPVEQLSSKIPSSDIQPRVAVVTRPAGMSMRPHHNGGSDTLSGTMTTGPAAESYCTILGLKLNEAVTKALIGGLDGVVWEKRRPVPVGRGKALGAAISCEFTCVPNASDTFTQRAVLRTVQRPLSVLLTSVQGMVSGLLASPQFLPTYPIPAALTAPQAHALSLATFARELSDALDIPGARRFVIEGLAPYRAQLDGIESRICVPITAAVKQILVILSDGLSSTHMSPKDHPAILGLQQSLTGATKILSKVVGHEPHEKHEVWISQLVSDVVWRGMVALVFRPYTGNGSNSPERRLSPPPGNMPSEGNAVVNPQLSAPASRFAIKQLVSRPATPLALRPNTPTPLRRDALAFQAVCTSLASSLPRQCGVLSTDILSEAHASLSQLLVLLALPRTIAVVPGSIPELDMLSSTLVLAYLLPRDALQTITGIDEVRLRNDCLGDQASADRWDTVFERAVAEWSIGKEEWSAVQRWLLGDHVNSAM